MSEAPINSIPVTTAHGDPIAKLLALGVPQDKLREVIDDYYLALGVPQDKLREIIDDYYLTKLMEILRTYADTPRVVKIIGKSYSYQESVNE